MMVALVVAPATSYAKKQKAETPAAVAPVTRTARTLDPCEELALQECETFRAAGSAIAAQESAAKSAAIKDAQNQLVQMIRVVVSGGSQDYSKNMDGDKKSTQTIGEEVMNQFIYQSLELTKPILWSKYDLSNGQIQVYVCMEMLKKPEEILSNIQSQPQPQITSYGAGGVALPQSSPTAAALQSNPEADAVCDAGREDCLRQNYREGVPKMMKAVEMGSVKAHYYVGLLYLYGDNVQQDSKRAFQYILKAANSGYKDATFQIAEMYNSGTGVAKDKVQARYWYERAGELGDTRAESRLRRL